MHYNDDTLEMDILDQEYTSVSDGFRAYDGEEETEDDLADDGLTDDDLTGEGLDADEDEEESSEEEAE